MAVLDRAWMLAYNPGVHPRKGGLPGMNVLVKVMGTLDLYTIVAAVGALCVSALVWAWGHHTGGHQAEEGGKKGVRIAAGVALLAGAANGIVAFFSHLGSEVH